MVIAVANANVTILLIMHYAQNRVALNKRNRIAEVMLKEGKLQCLLDEKMIVCMLALYIRLSGII